VARSQSKLANEKFVNNAPEKIVTGEREKLDVNSRMLATLSRRLDEYI
jgi:valyl-tRNA synthetase